MNWNHLRKQIVFEGTEHGFTPTKQIIAPASLLQFFSCPRSPGSTPSPAASKVRKHLFGEALLFNDFRVKSFTRWKFLFIVLKGSIWFNHFKGDGRWSDLGWNRLLQHNGISDVQGNLLFTFAFVCPMLHPACHLQKHLKIRVCQVVSTPQRKQSATS